MGLSQSGTFVKYIKTGAHFRLVDAELFANALCAGLYGLLRSSLLASLSKSCYERYHRTGRYLHGPMYKSPVLTCCTAFVQCEKCEASSKQAVFSVHVLVFSCVRL